MVLFSVLDHFLRRPENQKRVIGTLLGTVSANVVEITNSFAVPHLEQNEKVGCGAASLRLPVVRLNMCLLNSRGAALLVLYYYRLWLV